MCDIILLTRIFKCPSSIHHPTYTQSSHTYTFDSHRERVGEIDKQKCRLCKLLSRKRRRRGGEDETRGKVDQLEAGFVTHGSQWREQGTVGGMKSIPLEPDPILYPLNRRDTGRPCHCLAVLLMPAHILDVASLSPRLRGYTHSRQRTRVTVWLVRSRIRSIQDGYRVKLSSLRGASSIPCRNCPPWSTSKSFFV